MVSKCQELEHLRLMPPGARAILTRFFSSVSPLLPRSARLRMCCAVADVSPLLPLDTTNVDPQVAWQRENTGVACSTGRR